MLTPVAYEQVLADRVAKDKGPSRMRTGLTSDGINGRGVSSQLRHRAHL